MARHCTEAGLTEKAAGLWGKAGQRSLDRPALVEAIEQLTRALAQIAALPATPLLRREQIKHQVVSGARAIGQSRFVANGRNRPKPVGQDVKKGATSPPPPFVIIIYESVRGRSRSACVLAPAIACSYWPSHLSARPRTPPKRWAEFGLIASDRRATGLGVESPYEHCRRPSYRAG